MGDSERVVTQTTSMMAYTSMEYVSTDNFIENAASDAVTSDAGVVGDVPSKISARSGDMEVSTDVMVTDNTSEHTQNLTDENGNQNLTKEGVPAAMNDVSLNVAPSASESMDTSHVSAYSTLYGTDATEAKNVVLDVGENGITSVANEFMSDAPALSAEEERLWSIVRANSLEFDAWTALIVETEKVAEGHISKIRKVYDAFLAEFPLCYGYWKKYTDHEERMGSTDKVVEVYERAVQGVTYSVDMWLHYCVFAINTYGDPDTIRRLFERGLVYVGSDFLSYTIWDKYIEYEYTQQEWSRLAMIYTRILENPNQQLDRYFNSFRELVAHRLLSELRTAEEAAAAALGATGQEIKGEVHPNAVESTKPVSAGITEAEELEKYITIREEMYKKAKEFQSKIIGFETAIRRPYFHVRPLNPVELENWNNYLDFIEAEEDFQKVVKLYERCLIACANYPEYWIRYILHMEARGSTDQAENALARATQVFVKRRPEIHLFAARSREHSGAIPGARAAYELVHAEMAPGLLDAIVKHANMEHRMGNAEDACSLYEQAIAIEKGKEYSQTLPQLFAQYSRFVYLICGKAEKAREILEQALEKCPPSKSLLEAVIHLESIQSTPKRIEYLDSLINKFIASNPDNSGAASFIDREELSSIFLEFLDHFADAQSVKKAEDRHAELFIMHKSRSEPTKSTKRNPTLPPKVIIKILAHCGPYERTRFRCVSKCWNALIGHRLFRRLLFDVNSPSILLNDDATVLCLLKLSVKSLIRFASLSTFSRDLVEDPYFVKQHFEFNRSHNSAIICNNIWDENGRRRFVLLRVKGPPIPVIEFDKNFEVDLSSITFRQFAKGMVLAGSVNGLVCLTNNNDFAESLIALWNPARRSWKPIPLPHTKSWKSMSVGLGYDAATNDYKIICIVPDFKGGSRIEIYSSNGDLWAEVGDVSFSPEVGLHCRCIVKGVPYWIGNDKELGECQFLARVSPCSGLFERFRYPQGINEKFCHLVNMRDSVAVLVQSLNMYSAEFLIDLYVMEESDGKWTKLHSIGSFKCEGLWVPQCMGTGEIVVLTFNHYSDVGVTFFCNPQSGHLLRNDEIVEFHPSWFNSYSYAESMVSVKGMTYIGMHHIDKDETQPVSEKRDFLSKDYESALHLYFTAGRNEASKRYF